MPEPGPAMTLPSETTSPSGTLGRLLAERRALIGIVGLGYVGLPLALAALRAGFSVLGFDVDPGRVAALNRGEGAFHHIPATRSDRRWPPAPSRPPATWRGSTSPTRY